MRCAAGAVCLGLLAGCGVRIEEGSGDLRSRRAETVPARSASAPGSDQEASALGDPVSLELEGARPLSGVDWEEAVYLSVCGLSRVSVVGGVGEASSLGSTYGVEVIDADLADLDDDGEDDAAVLVDCLGGDSYQPHVIVVPPDGVLGDVPPQLAVSSGGSLPAGDVPVGIEARDGGVILVTVTDAGAPTVHELLYAHDVLIGGELTARPGQVIDGVISSFSDGVAVISVTPDDGYRLTVPAGRVATDPAGGVPVSLDQVIGVPVTVTTADGATVESVSTVPVGGGM